MDIYVIMYSLMIRFIRMVKWAELQFLKLFTPLILKYGKKLFGKKLGVVLHFNDESYKNWSPAEEKKALAKCNFKYDTIVHLRVRDPMLAATVVNSYSWGIGEGYTKGQWGVCEGRDERDLMELAKRFMENDFSDLYYNWWNNIWYYLEFYLFNLQTKEKATEVGEKHYDLGNDIFETILDPWMQYSCGYWANASNLGDAQVAKLELIAKKLQLKPGMRLLDIGCGWGKTCKYFAEKYGVECVGVTISKEQVEYGRRMCKGLPVEIRLQDYRDVDESFDRIVSVGMFEHVGLKNYDTFFKVAKRNLKEDGLFLLHTIGRNHINFTRFDRWTCNRIFPNASFPNTRDITQSTQPHFVIEDWHNFGHDYSKTLHAWSDAFRKGWPALEGKYGEGFYRMWMFYLCAASGVFASRKCQLWQVVFSKDGLKGGYRSVR